MYSQKDEEKYILDYFGGQANGKLLEIGAYDPFEFSNTRALIELGWSAVMVEPNPICMDRLKKEYANNDKIVLVEKAVTDSDGIVTFYQPQGDAVGTVNVPHKERWSTNNNVNFKEITVESISMVNLVEAHYPNGCDFLSLDVEGINLELFHLLPIDFVNKTRLLCIEHDGHADYMAYTLASYGFRFITKNEENLIMGR